MAVEMNPAQNRAILALERAVRRLEATLKELKTKLNNVGITLELYGLSEDEAPSHRVEVHEQIKGMADEDE